MIVLHDFANKGVLNVLGGVLPSDFCRFKSNSSRRYSDLVVNWPVFTVYTIYKYKLIIPLLASRS